MFSSEETIEAGTLAKPHGKKGEIRCNIHPEIWDRADVTFIFIKLNGLLVPYRIVEWDYMTDEHILVSLKGIEDENEASALCGHDFYILRTDLTQGEEETLMWQDLKGYRVTDRVQGRLGIVKSVDESTINTLIEIEPEDKGGKTILIPIHEDFIASIDQETKNLTIELPFQL